jgi:7,8-dihydropterin-6-yl-methyl-4-(beta-D-ribofuranosyl)aminobenzene 5'-phosphate synthase
VQVCNSSHIKSILGGFHLINLTDEKLRKTIDYLSKVDGLYPCHCVDFKSKQALLKSLNVNEIGVGLSLHIK